MFKLLHVVVVTKNQTVNYCFTFNSHHIWEERDIRHKRGWCRHYYCIHVLFVHRLWWRIKCHNKQSLLTISIIKTMLNLCSNIYERLFYHILCLHLRDTKWRKKFSNGPKLTHQMGRQVLFNFPSKRPLTINKFALLWGEAQLCLPYDC